MIEWLPTLGADEDARHPFSAIYRPSFTAAAIWTCTGRLDQACAAFGRVYESVLEQGDESSIPLFGIVPVLAECMRGDLGRAEDYATAVAQASQYIGGNLPHLLALNARITVDAYRGAIVPASMTAFLALSKGDPAACHRAIGPVIDQGSAVPGIAQLLCNLAGPDEIEALVALGELDAAARLLDWAEEHVAVGGRASEAAGWRGHALLAAAGGELDLALAHADRSVAQYRTLPMPVDLARSLLVKGRIHRRRKEKSPARTALEEAGSRFGGVGADLWCERAAAELARVGQRPADHTELTATEARVAEPLASPTVRWVSGHS